MFKPIRTIVAAGFLTAMLTAPVFAEPVARPDITGFDTVMVGTTRVTALYKGYVSGVRQDQVAYAYNRLVSANMTSPSPLTPQIAAFVIDDGAKVTLVCLEGREPAAAERGYVMSHLVAAGYAPEDIDEIRVADQLGAPL